MMIIRWWAFMIELLDVVNFILEDERVRENEARILKRELGEWFLSEYYCNLFESA